MPSTASVALPLQDTKIPHPKETDSKETDSKEDKSPFILAAESIHTLAPRLHPQPSFCTKKHLTTLLHALGSAARRFEHHEFEVVMGFLKSMANAEVLGAGRVGAPPAL